MVDSLYVYHFNRQIKDVKGRGYAMIWYDMMAMQPESMPACEGAINYHSLVRAWQDFPIFDGWDAWLIDNLLTTLPIWLIPMYSIYISYR